MATSKITKPISDKGRDDKINGLIDDITNIEDFSAFKFDTSNYQTQQNSPKYKDIYLKSGTGATLSQLSMKDFFADTDDKAGFVAVDGNTITVAGGRISVSSSKYYDKTAVNNLISNVENQIPDTSNYYNKTEIDTALSGKQAAGDYATNTALTNGLAGKQDTLVSGTTIKTFNGNSLLGSGNISIPTTTVDDALSTTSENPVQNKLITNELDNKANYSGNSIVQTNQSYVAVVDTTNKAIKRYAISKIRSGLASTSDIPTIATSVNASSTNAETVGAKLFYDTCGDIETLINAL